MALRKCLAACFVAGAFAGSAPDVHAHVVLSQTSFEAGSRFAAFFKVEHGCDGSPTLSLRVEIPDGVTVLEVPPKDGWTINAERVKGRIDAVSWRGRLEAGAKDQFGLLLQLPARTGALYFPTVQRCAKGEMRWTSTPASAQVASKVVGPAPVVQLTPPASPPVSTYMTGSIMIVEPWTRATPPGATTGAGYLTLMNHGATADVLLGGSTLAAAALQIHRVSNANGIMTMRPATEGVTIPPGATVELKPESGYHFMLVGLKAPLKAGTRLPVTLTFAKAGPVQVEFFVEAIGALSPSGPHVTGHDPH